MGSLIEYYNNYNEEERLFKSNANMIEFITTVTRIDPLIKKDDKIIELGAGTGTYSFYYNDKGHSVVALDIVPEHVNIIKEKIDYRNCKNIQAYLGNATDLSKFEDESFDIVLCLGPMYHLISESDQIKCMEESKRVLKKDGILAVAYINKHFVLSNMMFQDKKYRSERFIGKILDEGFLRASDEDNFWIESKFFNPKEIEDLVNNLGFTKIENIATDGLGRLFSEKVNEMDKNEFEIFKNYHLKSCTDESLLGYSNHGLYLARKK